MIALLYFAKAKDVNTDLQVQVPLEKRTMVISSARSIAIATFAPMGRTILCYILLASVLLACGTASQNDELMSQEKGNALIHESSPYLLQHAHNPVNWMPWGDEAFEKARTENKLVLVSIGYSACHWCHVMERETFEDSLAADYMNEHFICIKVDREERPDVDQVYMDAVQLMTQQGGWPLNCFTLPDGRPVYGGTYFPTDQWMKVLESLVEIQQEQLGKMEDYARRLTEGIQQSQLIQKAEDTVPFERSVLDTMVTSWSKHWDQEEGGPNRAPKFPLPNNFEFLLQYGHLSDNDAVKSFVRLTLDKMAQGGIYDQIGGGFARYSVDGIWKVPHFEKMLYDNGQLVSLYAKAFAAFDEPAYRTVIEQTLAFVDRELSASEGGFYSALDADSEGEEGKFYVWTEDELKSILDDDYDLAAEYYNVNARGHWEHGNYILLRTAHPAEYAEKHQMDAGVLKVRIEEINAQLMKARAKRVRPGLDDKQLTSWNALMIKGYADAYRALGNEAYLDRAKQAMNFILSACRRDDGGLWHSYKNGEARINGYLEDYCFTLEALIALYEVSFEEHWLNVARELADYTLAHFSDNESRMFWFTSDLDDLLIARKQEVMDNVIPASNSSMAKALWQLGTYFDNAEYSNRAAQMLRNVQSEFGYGQNFSNWATLMCWQTWPYYEVAITGPDGASVLHREIASSYLPNTLLMGGASGELPLLEGKFTDEATVYVCLNKTCKLPVNTAQNALSQIN